MYAIITIKADNTIEDLEFLDTVPQFSDRLIDQNEDAFPDRRIRVFHGYVNGGDSQELHWNDQGGEWL